MVMLLNITSFTIRMSRGLLDTMYLLPPPKARIIMYLDADAS